MPYPGEVWPSSVLSLLVPVKWAWVKVGVGPAKPDSLVKTGIGRAKPNSLVKAGVGPAKPDSLVKAGVGPAKPDSLVKAGVGPAKPESLVKAGVGPAKPESLVKAGVGPAKPNHLVKEAMLVDLMQRLCLSFSCKSFGPGGCIGCSTGCREIPCLSFLCESNVTWWLFWLLEKPMAFISV